MDTYVRLVGKIQVCTQRELITLVFTSLNRSTFIFSKSSDMSNCCKWLLIIYNYIECILELMVISNIILDFLMRGIPTNQYNEGCPLTLMFDNCRWKNWLPMQSYDGALLSSLGKDKQAIFHINCYSLCKIDKCQLGWLLAIWEEWYSQIASLISSSHLCCFELGLH